MISRLPLSTPGAITQDSQPSSDPGSTRCTRSRAPCPAGPHTWEQRPGGSVAHARLGAHRGPRSPRIRPPRCRPPLLLSGSAHSPRIPLFRLLYSPSLALCLPSNPRASLWHRGAATAGARVASRTQSPSAVILEPRKIKCDTVSTTFPIYFPRSDGTRCHDICLLNVEL